MVTNVKDERRLGTEHGTASRDGVVATVWDGGTEATRAVTGRLTQTWGLWSGRDNVVGRSEERWVGDN